MNPGFLNPLVWWRRLQRHMDHQILVPGLRDMCRTPALFARAFAIHVEHDPAWRVPDWELTKADSDLLQECAEGYAPPARHSMNFSQGELQCRK